MKKIKDTLINFIVDKKYFILVVFTILSIFSLFISSKVNINYDISAYLPKSSETRIGKDLMDENFSGVSTSTLNLMFKDLENEKREQVKTDISNIEGVKEVSHDDSSDYNKDEYTLYIITVDDKEDSKTATDVYNEIVDKYSDYEIYTSGSVSEWNKPVLHMWIIAFAIISAMIILIIMCESYVEPFLFLYAIGLAVFVNMGTNIIFPSVSHITNSIAAILQLALSMDYSIMLMNRYSQEREKEKNKNEAMKKALVHATSAIASSSVTTIVGLLALVFMSFTIGADLGFVLAKGVLLSLVSIFLVLPALILLFDKAIEKTKKKSLNVSMTPIGKFVYNFRHPIAFIFIIIFCIAFVLKDGVNILYTGSENDEIASVFSENNQIAVIYKQEKEEKVASVIKDIDDENVPEILAYGNTIGEKLKYLEVNEKLESLGLDTEVDDYLLKLVYYNYYNKDDNRKMTIDEFVNFVNKEILTNKEISKNIDKSTKDNLKKLSNFSDPKKINKKRSAKEIASILDVDEDLVKDIYVLKMSKNITNKMGIDEFINFLSTNVLTNQKYSSFVSNDVKSNLKTITPFINKNVINKEVNSDTLSQMFNIPKSDINNIMLLEYTNKDNNIKLSLVNILDGIKVINKNSNMLDGVDLSSLLNLESFIYNKNNINNTKLNKGQLKNVFGGINENLVAMVYYSLQLDDNITFTPYEFVNLVISKMGANIGADNLNNLNMLSMVMKSVNDNTLYSSFEIADLLNIDKNKVNALYTLIAINNNYEFRLSPYALVNLMLSNNEVLSKLSQEQVNSLNTLNFIMTSINNNKKFSASDASNALGIKVEDVSLVYSLYYSKNVSISLNDLTKFILSDIVNDKKYNKYFDNETKEKLESINTIMSSSLKKEKFNSGKIYVMLSSLTDALDEDLIELVYLYNGSVTDFNDSYELTLEELVTYLNKDVLNDDMYKDFLDKDIKNKIIDADDKIKSAKEMLISNGYARAILNTKYFFEGSDTFAFVEDLKNKLDGDDIYVIGDSPMAYEMSKSFNGELNFITVLTMIAIFTVVAITFKSLIIPFILVLIIQCAVYITMSILSLSGTNVYFISLLIVQSILMGATIDYAIVYTTYYLEMRRKKKDVKESLIEAYNKSIHTILCSSSILVIVTLIVGNFASQIAAKICMTLSKGSLCAALLILIVLPPILAMFDKYIVKK